MTKDEIKDKIIEKQDERDNFKNDALQLFADFLTKMKEQKYNEIISLANTMEHITAKIEAVKKEINFLKFQLSEAGGVKNCSTCKWCEIGYGHCVWCLRNTPHNYELSLKTSGYADNWQPR